MNETSYLDPQQVRWPTQFVGEHGDLLICGAFDEGEEPFGLQICDVCKNLAGFSHLASERHRRELVKMKQTYMCFWQELLAPDQRPFYYDHVSHTWTFAKPRQTRLEISQAVEPLARVQEPEEQDEEIPGPALPEKTTEPQAWPASNEREDMHQDSNVDGDYDIDERLRSLLGATMAQDRQDEDSEEEEMVEECGIIDEGIPQDDPRICPYCNKQFMDESSKVQHLSAMSGRRWHPVVEWVDGGEQRWGAPVPFGLDAVRDVVKETPDGDRTREYYYNPKTGFVAWTEREVVKANLMLYPCLRRVPLRPELMGPNGEVAYWYHMEMKITEWSLETLLKTCVAKGWQPDFDGEEEDEKKKGFAQERSRNVGAIIDI